MFSLCPGYLTVLYLTSVTCLDCLAPREHDPDTLNTGSSYDRGLCTKGRELQDQEDLKNITSLTC